MSLDLFPSISPQDLNRALDLLGAREGQAASYPPNLKADLTDRIRRLVRAIQQMKRGLALPVHADLLAFVGKADRDWPLMN
jgi:hypothetical protein